MYPGIVISFTVGFFAAVAVRVWLDWRNRA